MKKLSYRLFLYSPAAAAVTLDNSASYFLGELYADNVDVNIKLHDVSTISFTLPQVINGAANPRLNEVLDSYVIELWYGKTDGVYANGDFKKIRFIIYKTPQEFNDDKYLYKYSGYSLESILEFKNIVSWRGIRINDYYRPIVYNNTVGSPAFTDADSSSVTIYGTAPKKYITIFPTTATVRDLDVYLYEVRENITDDITTKTSLISYTSLSGTPWTDNDFKPGYYYLAMSGDYVSAIYIALPENYIDFNDYLLTEKKFSYHLYDNPVGRHIAFGITKNQGEQTNYYINLAQQANLGDETPEYEGYTFVTEYDYFKNGLTIKQIMLGDQEETTLNEDGVLYNTGFTLGTVHADFNEMYRSNIELNNLTKYQAIKTIAESFDAIPVFDSVNKTVSFYPENPTSSSPWVNNGLIFQYGAYLRAVQKDIDASKIITMGRGLGKDNYPISLVTPDGQPVWEDYEYFLDDFYISDTTGFTITSDGTTGLSITYPASKSNYLSRWMSAAQAEALGGWQYARDYFHNLMSGEVSPIDSNHNDFENLYVDRLAALESRVKLSTELEKRKALKFKYYTLKEHYKKQNIANPSEAYNDKQVYYTAQYNNLSSQVTSVESRLAVIDTLIYDETSAGSFAYKLAQVKNFLDKETWGVNLTLLQTFQRESVISDSKIDDDYELLLSTITHVNENKLPKITIQVDVADILAAEESYQDWDKVVVGEAINIYLPEINIDDEILVREISINFESNTLALVISSVRNYNRNILTNAFRLVRDLKNSQMNFSEYLYDRNNENNTIVDDTQETIENGDVPINPSTDDTNGEPGTTTNPEGTQSNEVDDDSIDPETETYDFIRSTSGIIVHDGRLLGFKQFTPVGLDPYTIETEVSAQNGFEIRKVEGSAENDDLAVTRQMYIDTDGNAVFSGFLSINQSTVGYDEQGVFIGEDGQVSKFSLVSGNTSMVFDPAATDYKLKINGEAKIGPLTLGSIGSTFVTGISGTTYPKIITGQVDILQSDFTFSDTDITNVGVTHFIYQQGGTITSRTMKIELYKNSSKVYDSAVVSIPDIVGYNIETTYFDFPLINADAVRVIITGTESVSGSAGWQVTEQPIISTPSANIKMGNFSVDSQGLLSTTNGIFTNQATFGNLSSIKIQGGSSGNFTSTFSPSTNFTAHQNIGVPDQTGTILLNTTNPGPALNIYSTNNITISNEGYANRDINIIADDNLILESATNDVELNAADHIDLVATNGTYVYGDLTVNNNLIVKGATITVDSTTLTVNDKNIEIGSVDNSDRPFTVISGSDQITGGNTLGIFEGQTITGSGIPAGTTVDSVVNSSTIRMSANATITGTPATLTFGRKFNTTNLNTSINAGNTRGLIVGQSITGTGIPANTRISSIVNETTLVMTNAATSTNTQTSLVFGSATDFTADGGGITLKGASDKTIIWYDDNNAWEFNQGIEVIGNGISLEAGQPLKLSGISDATHEIFHDASTDYDVVEYSTGFQLRHYSTGNQLTLDGATGNIGIGTTSPLNKLDIRITGADSDNGIIITRADSTTTVGDLLGGVGFDSTDGNTPSSILEASTYIAAFAAESHSTGDKGGYLIFGTAPIDQDDDTLSLDRVIITSEGNVGIGSISNTLTEKLDVNGSIKHTGLVMTTGTNVDQIQQTTFTSALTTAWTDVTGVSGTYLTTGSYIVQIESNGEYYTGQMSWFSGSTTSAIADEIQLHRAGPTASAARIYARVIRVSAGTLKLQVAASTSVGSHTMTFKFRRTI